MSASTALMERFENTGRTIVAVLILCVTIVITLAMAGDLPSATAKPPTAPTDSQGYVNSPARCDPRQTAVAVGRTPVSLIAICADGRGGYQYRGMRLSDRAILVLPAAKLANGCFGVRGDNVYYTVSERKLLLTSGMRVLRDEAMVEYQDFSAPTVVPVSNLIPSAR